MGLLRARCRASLGTQLRSCPPAAPGGRQGRECHPPCHPPGEESLSGERPSLPAGGQDQSGRDTGTQGGGLPVAPVRRGAHSGLCSDRRLREGRKAAHSPTHTGVCPDHLWSCRQIRTEVPTSRKPGLHWYTTVSR